MKQSLTNLLKSKNFLNKLDMFQLRTLAKNSGTLLRIVRHLQGESKKRNLFELEYLKDGLLELNVLLLCFSVLPYNFIEPKLSFLWWLWPEIWRFEVGLLKSWNFEKYVKSKHFIKIIKFVSLKIRLKILIQIQQRWNQHFGMTKIANYNKTNKHSSLFRPSPSHTNSSKGFYPL